MLSNISHSHDTNMMTSEVEERAKSVAEVGSQALRNFAALLVAIDSSAQDSLDRSSTARSPSDLPSQLQHNEIENEHQRFQLWAANLGLLGQGHWSLDYRLRDATFVKDFVMDLLSELTQTISRLLEIVSGRRTPFDRLTVDEQTDISLPPEPPATMYEESDEEPSSGSDSDTNSTASFHGQPPGPSRTELAARTEELIDIIDRLYKLAFKIRSPAMRTGPDKRDLYKHYPPEEKEMILAENEALENRRVETLIIQARKDAKHSNEHITQNPLSEQHISDEDGSNDSRLNEQLSQLIKRMGKANTQRRAQFIYWRRQRVKIERVTGDLPEAVKTPAAPQLKTNLAIHRKHLLHMKSTIASSAPASASRLDPAKVDLFMPDNRSTLSRVTRAPTAHGPSGEHAEWPKPTDLPLGKEFECPYCFLICPGTYRDKAAWRSHLIHDLRPYMCTYLDCSNPSQLFDTWKDWTAHEESEHRQVWRCHDHDPEEFISREEYESHVQEMHPHQSVAMVTPEALSASQSSTRHLDRNCPFCDLIADSLEEMQKHIAYHLETIALFALPRSTGLEKGSQMDDIDSDAVRGQSDSRFSDSQLSGWQETDHEAAGMTTIPKENARLTLDALREVHDQTKGSIDDKLKDYLENAEDSTITPGLSAPPILEEIEELDDFNGQSISDPNQMLEREQTLSTSREVDRSSPSLEQEPHQLPSIAEDSFTAFDIIEACMQLESNLDILQEDVARFVSSFRGARNDMTTLSRELSSLALIVEILRKERESATVSRNHIPTLLRLLIDCDCVVAEMRVMLSALSPGRPTGQNIVMQWRVADQNGMNRLRSTLRGTKEDLEQAVYVAFSKEEIHPPLGSSGENNHGLRKGTSSGSLRSRKIEPSISQISLPQGPSHDSLNPSQENISTTFSPGHNTSTILSAADLDAQFGSDVDFFRPSETQSSERRSLEQLPSQDLSGAEYEDLDTPSASDVSQPKARTGGIRNTLRRFFGRDKTTQAAEATKPPGLESRTSSRTSPGPAQEPPGSSIPRRPRTEFIHVTKPASMTFPDRGSMSSGSDTSSPDPPSGPVPGVAAAPTAEPAPKETHFDPDFYSKRYGPEEPPPAPTRETFPVIPWEESAAARSAASLAAASRAAREAKAEATAVRAGFEEQDAGEF